MANKYNRSYTLNSNRFSNTNFIYDNSATKSTSATSSSGSGFTFQIPQPKILPTYDPSIPTDMSYIQKSQSKANETTDIDNDFSYHDISDIDASENVVEPVKRTLNDFSLSSSKSDRYRQLASNLSTLSSSYAKKAGNTQAGFNVFNGIMTGVNAVASAINPWAGVATTALTGIVNLFNDSGKKQEESANFAQMQQNMVSYLTNLTNRDTTIMNTMDSIYSSMDNMRGTYGSSFVDQMYNYYLAQSGMTSDAYSMLTGNFTNFELGNGKYGNMSAEGGVFDTLTDGNQGMFNNIYAQLQMGDLSSNTKLMDSLVQSLYGANTEFGISMRGYETELRNALLQSSLQQSQYMFGAKSDLASIGANGRSENISATESIGSAEADQATSGLRGGTTSNNANLARLQRDLGQIQRTAQTASVIGTLKYNIQNAQLNASSTAFSYRQAQRKAVTGALNSTIATWNSIGRTAQSGERESNYYIDEAKSNKRQFEEGFNNIRNDADKDKFLEAASN